MARNPLIEAIHAARYDLETCPRHERAAHETRLEQAVRQALDRSHSKVSPEQLLDALFDDYREFRRARKRQEWARMPPSA